MEWTERVRRALTLPSGQLRDGVSPTVYRKWRAATQLAKPSHFYHQHGEMGPSHILQLARNNTSAEQLREFRRWPTPKF